MRQAPARLALSLVRTEVDDQPCIHMIGRTHINGVNAREDATYTREAGRADFIFQHGARLTVLQSYPYLYIRANYAAYRDLGASRAVARRDAGIWFAARHSDPEFRAFRLRAFFGYELLRPAARLTKHIRGVGGHTYAVFRGFSFDPEGRLFVPVSGVPLPTRFESQGGLLEVRFVDYNSPIDNTPPRHSYFIRRRPPTLSV